ncbi:hypothetical protein [Aeromonas veronii]|uniref:hypothetical protein n=1 Tax=Aeromonas veronii TaxID=654 RepID=UPI002B480A46|nr:hypothetical protein [Aeromonas veronii]
MNIDDIISSLDSGGPKSYYDFEKFIQELFKTHLKGQGKEFITPNEKISLVMVLLLQDLMISRARH